MVDPAVEHKHAELQQVEKPSALQHNQEPGSDILLIRAGIAPELARPRQKRPEQQLVVEQNHDQHDQNGVPDRTEIALFNRGGDIRADAGQHDRLPGYGDCFRGDDEEPAARDRHHHVPEQRWYCMRHFEPPEPAPGRQVIHPRRLDQLGRHGAQRLVQAERHVPGLRGEDREDRGAFDPEQPARKQRDEPGDGDRQKAKDRHRLQDVEHRDQDLFRLPALRCERGIAETEDQRDDQRRGHAQYRAQRVFRQPPRVEADRQRVADLVLGAHRHAAPRDQRQDPEHQRQRHEVPDIRAQPRRPGDQG